MKSTPLCSASMSGIGQGALLNVDREVAVDGPTAIGRDLDVRGVPSPCCKNATIGPEYLLREHDIRRRYP